MKGFMYACFCQAPKWRPSLLQEKRKAKKALKKAKKEAKQAKQDPKPAKDAAPSSTDENSSDDAPGDEVAANGSREEAAEGLKRIRHDSPTPEEQASKRVKPAERSQQRQRCDSESPQTRRHGGSAAARHERSALNGDNRRHRENGRDEDHRRKQVPASPRRDAARKNASLSPPRHRDRHSDRRGRSPVLPRQRDASVSPPRHRERGSDSRHDRRDKFEENNRDRERRGDRRWNSQSLERRRRDSRSPEKRR